MPSSTEKKNNTDAPSRNDETGSKLSLKCPPRPVEMKHLFRRRRRLLTKQWPGRDTLNSTSVNSSETFRATLEPQKALGAIFDCRVGNSDFWMPIREKPKVNKKFDGASGRRASASRANRTLVLSLTFSDRIFSGATFWGWERGVEIGMVLRRTSFRTFPRRTRPG